MPVLYLRPRVAEIRYRMHDVVEHHKTGQETTAMQGDSCILSLNLPESQFPLLKFFFGNLALGFSRLFLAVNFTLLGRVSMSLTKFGPPTLAYPTVTPSLRKQEGWHQTVTNRPPLSNRTSCQYHSTNRCGGSILFHSEPELCPFWATCISVMRSSAECRDSGGEAAAWEINSGSRVPSQKCSVFKQGLHT